MAARAAVQTLLTGDSVLVDLGFGEVLAANSVDTPPLKRFIIVKWDPTSVAFKTTGTDRVQIWCHDKDRDYTQIGLALRRIKTLLTDAVHVVGEDGWTLTTADWLGEGPDLYDGGYETCTRYADFQCATRYTAS